VIGGYSEGDAERVILLKQEVDGSWSTVPNPVSAGGGGGGTVTEYVEDAAAAANPQGGIVILRRKDTLSAAEVSADGDNIAANATSKGELYVKHPDTIGVTGTFWQATQPVSGPLTDVQLRATAVPVSGPLTDTQLRATPVPVSGTFWQATQPVSGSVSVSNFPATQPVSGTFWQATQPVSGPLTDTQLRASAVPVDTELTTQDYDSGAGTSTQAVSGLIVPGAGGPVAITGDAAQGLDVDVTRVSGTVAVSGPLTDTQLRAAAVPVSGTFWQATQPVSGPLTDTQLRATPVPVSGTVTATGPLTDTQLRASAVPVDVSDRDARSVGRVRVWDGTNPASLLNATPAGTEYGLGIRDLSQPDVVNSGTLTASGQAVTITCPGEQTTWALDVRGTFSAGSTISFEATIDGTNFFAIEGRDMQATTPVTGTSTAGGGSRNFRGEAAGYKQIRFRCSAFAVADSINVTARVGKSVYFYNPLKASDPTIFDTGAIVRPLDSTLTPFTRLGRGHEVQQVRDTGRAHWSIYVNADTAEVASPITTEAMLTMRRSIDGAAASTGTDFTVTSGKRFAITSVLFSARHSAAVTGRMTLRWSTSAAITITSPIVTSWTYALAANAGDSTNQTFPEGFWIPSGGRLGVSALASVATAAINIQINGFEY
jgi:hypothetical protein